MNPDLPVLFGRPVRHLHCVGVGGMGVGPLAIYLAGLGFTVSGEDDAMSDEMRAQLVAGGVRLGAMPDTCELVAYSSAIAVHHPAWIAATSRNIPLVRRGELLAEATRSRRLVAVCGSHGKTTTTAMLITALRRANFPAGYVLGGLFADDSTPASAGENDWVVAEIDESDGTIERFSPEITVAVNLDWDHPDHYRRQTDIEAAFHALFARTRRAVLVCDSCEMSARVVGAMTGTESTAAFFKFGPMGDFQSTIAAEQRDGMTLELGGRFQRAAATVRARGGFNAANATAALAAAELMGAPVVPDALADYPAVRRRQAVLWSNGFTVLEDYAHHPAEIRALVGSLRRRIETGGRLVVVFQPHRFSRTAQFKAEFASVLAEADQTFLLDVYSAGEAPVAGGTTADLVRELQRIAPSGQAMYVGSAEALYAALSRDVRARDLVAFVGAGDIDKMAREWVKRHGGAARSAASSGAGGHQPERDHGTAEREAKLGAATKWNPPQFP